MRRDPHLIYLAKGSASAAAASPTPKVCGGFGAARVIDTPVSELGFRRGGGGVRDGLPRRGRSHVLDFLFTAASQ